MESPRLGSKKLNNKGQVVIEYILLMVLAVGGITFLANTFRESQTIAKLVDGPWQKMAGMIECGVWEARKDACTKHPNNLSRSLSYEPR